MMTLTPEILDEIEAVARAPGVTPGPWYNDCGNGEVESRNKDTPRRVVCQRPNFEEKFEIENRYGVVIEGINPDDDMDYIATVSPEVALAMVAEIKRLREIEDKYNELLFEKYP